MDIKPNAEIIVPSFTFISTVNSTLFINAIPKFADIEEDTFGIDPEKIENVITSETKAIIPVHIGGNPCKILELKEIAEKNNLLLIEDAAESLGASINDKKIGTIGDSSIFSFCGNKVLTTGEGGAIVTDSKEIYEKVKLIRSHGRIDKINYFNNPEKSEYVDIGYNWRMSSITASLGISQMNKLEKIIKKRQDNAKYISDSLEKIKEIQVPRQKEGNKHIFQMYTIRLEDKKSRNDLHAYLTEKRIFSKVYFEPVHLADFYKKKFGTSLGMLPITEKIAEQVLTLPLYPNMTNEEKDYLISTIREFFETYSK